MGSSGDLRLGPFSEPPSIILGDGISLGVRFPVNSLGVRLSWFDLAVSLQMSELGDRLRKITFCSLTARKSDFESYGLKGRFNLISSVIF